MIPAVINKIPESRAPVDLDTDADVIGITGFVVHKRRMFELAEAFRRRGKLVVAGGPFATLCPEELRGKVDVLVVGEAEYTWPRFVRDYEGGAWQAEYRQDDKPSMLDSPLPRFHLLKADRYRSMAIQFARGCPFNCEFCDIIVMYGRRPRTKSVAQVLAEVEAIHALGVGNIFVVDDNFIGNKKDAKALLAALIACQDARGYPIEFMTEVSLNVAQDGELPRLMKLRHFTTASSRRGRRVSPRHTRRRTSARTSSRPSTASRPRGAGRLIAESVGDQFVFTNIVPRGCRAATSPMLAPTCRSPSRSASSMRRATIVSAATTSTRSSSSSASLNSSRTRQRQGGRALSQRVAPCPCSPHPPIQAHPPGAGPSVWGTHAAA
jgi:hypothetical protein